MGGLSGVDTVENLVVGSKKLFERGETSTTDLFPENWIPQEDRIEAETEVGGRAFIMAEEATIAVGTEAD